MSVFAAIRRFLVELDEAIEHARTGYPPARVRNRVDGADPSREIAGTASGRRATRGRS